MTKEDKEEKERRKTCQTIPGEEASGMFLSRTAEGQKRKG